MKNLDGTMDGMENTHFQTKFSSRIRRYSETTQFSANEVSGIFMVYYKFVLANGPTAKGMTRKQFNQIFITIFNIFDTRLIGRILMNITHDTNLVGPDSWMKLISIYMSNDIGVRMKFAFEVYDVKGSNALNRNDVAYAIEKFFTHGDEDEVNELRSDMLEFIFNKFDVEKNGYISFQDYSRVVRKQPALLEFMGKVFPSRRSVTAVAFCFNIYSHFEKINM